MPNRVRVHLASTMQDEHDLADKDLRGIKNEARREQQHQDNSADLRRVEKQKPWTNDPI